MYIYMYIYMHVCICVYVLCIRGFIGGMCVNSMHTGPGSSGGGGGGGGGGGLGAAAATGGGGGGGGGRRLFSEVPVHVQHLLEHQERQHFERASPSRRPVYRKIVSGMQGSGSFPVPYHISGMTTPTSCCCASNVH